MSLWREKIDHCSFDQKSLKTWKDCVTDVLHKNEFVEHGKGGNNGQWLLSVEEYTCNEGERSIWSSFDTAMRKDMTSVCLSKYIDEYFSNKQIGYYEILEQVVNGVKFFIHCQKKENYVTKIMSCYGDLN